MNFILWVFVIFGGVAFLWELIGDYVLIVLFVAWMYSQDKRRRKDG